MYAIVILVGGKGTRVKNLLNGKSKSEIEIFSKKKIIDYQINGLKHLNKKFFFLSNIKLHSFKKYIEKKYSKTIDYEIINETKPLGTAGCLKNLKKLPYDFFLILDGDLIFNINFKKFISFHNNNKADCSLLVHPNNHLLDSDCIDIDDKNKVLKLYKKPHKSNYINNLCLSGIKILNKKKILIIKKNKHQDFTKNFLTKLIYKKNKVFAYNTREYVKDAGTTKRINQVRKDIKSIKYKLGNLSKKIPAIFLDRDGVIVKQNDKYHYQNPSNIIKQAYEGIKIINSKGFLAVLITNQPAVAKGIISLGKLNLDFAFLTNKLGKHNVYLDRIYYCPHHPEKGFKNELRRFKIKCSCRKPNNGLLIKAIRELNIDIKKSYMIGDRLQDYKAAKKTKLKFLSVGKKNINNKIIRKNNILSAINFIFN